MKRLPTQLALTWLLLALGSLACLELGLVSQAYRNHAAASSSDGATLSRLSGVCFAIADFDGDWKPDLALLEAASAHLAPGNYAVRVRLSAGPELSFFVNAPGGGLRVSARDVNGDDVPDVVVSSVQDQRVVAVLLNDGHGRFSPAEPGVYLGTARDPDSFFHAFERPLGDTLTVASWRYSSESDGVRRPASFSALSACSPLPPENTVLPVVEWHTLPGRSPPFVKPFANDSFTVS